MKTEAEDFDSYSCYRCGDALSMEEEDICYHCLYDEYELEQNGMDDELAWTPLEV